MDAYVDYAYYTAHFEGKLIPENEFHSLARENSRLLDQYTLGKITEVTDLIKNTVCELCEEEYFSIHDQQITSESVGSGGVSVSYSSVKTADVEISKDRIIRRNLSGTGLLYRGICP